MTNWISASCVATATTLLMLGPSTGVSLGQSKSEPSGFEACASCGTCFVMIAAVFVLNIAFLVWVARDAKARGMDSAVLWMLLVMFLPFVGLIIYLFARPQGGLYRCQHCGNKRLQASAKCPHCHNT